MEQNPRQELKELAAANAWTIGLAFSWAILAAAMVIEQRHDKKAYAAYRAKVGETIAKINSGYVIECPNCGLSIISPSRARIVRAYISHIVNTCPGDPAYAHLKA